MKFLQTRIALALFALALAPAGAASRPARPAAHPFLDLDFEAPECSGGWKHGEAGDYDLRIDGSEAHSGRQSMVAHYSGRYAWALPSHALVARDFPIEAARGRTLRVTAFLRTEEVTAGAADLFWWVMDGQGNLIASVALGASGPRGTTPWTPYTVEISVPADAQEVLFGAQLVGNGTAWFDGFSLEADGQPWADGKANLAPPSRQAVSWLRKQAIPFATTEPGGGTADLQKLKPLIGGARVVSLGEQTHGTHEFFQMKRRLIELLAGEMGFTLFALEANMPEAEQINQYLRTGQGDPQELLKGLYWISRTQEMLDLIHWMREFNQSGRGPIQFLGVDMQLTQLAAANAQNLVSRAEPGYSGHARDLTNRVNAANSRGTAAAADVAAAQELFDHLSQNRGGYLSRLPREEVDWGIQNARILLQNMQFLAGTVSRDESMADNVGWILDQNPDARLILWAHNLHVSKSPGFTGSYLAERYGNQVVSLGFAFGVGSYNASDYYGAGSRVVANEALPPSANSVEAFLKSAGLPRFALDLRRVPAGAPAPWLKQPRPFREIGSLARRCSSELTVATDTFDGLIWIDPTSPSKLR